MPRTVISLLRRLLVASTALVVTGSGFGLVASARQGMVIAPPGPRDTLPGARTPPSREGTATISGVVVSADLGRPVRRANVRLSSTTPSPPVSVTADDQGRFTFERVAAGQFTLTASKAGYLDSIYGQKKAGSGRAGTPLSVGEGQRVERLSVPIARGGVLAGTVVDDGGEPAFGTDVRAMRYVWQNGERMLRVAGTARADDRGAFRISALPPGDYVVMAQPIGQSGLFEDVGVTMLAAMPMNGASNVGFYAGTVEAAVPQSRPGGNVSAANAPPAAPTTGYAPVYFPGTTSGASAAVITLGVSEERAALDLQLPLVPMGTVTGTVTSDDGRAIGGSEVRLTNLEQALPGLGVRTTIVGADGRFTFTNVAPARYRLNARSGSRQTITIDQVAGQTRVSMEISAVGRPDGAAPGLPFPPPSAPEPARWATAEVIVAGRDTQSVSLPLQPGVTVSGRVFFDGGAQAPANLSSIRVVLNGAGVSDGPASASATVDADGRFAIAGVIPGRYRVLALTPNGLRARSFDVGGADALDLLLTVADRNIADATLTFTSRSSAIAGSLRQPSGQPAADYTIVVFADDARFWTSGSRRIQATRPATDGGFTFRDLPAGAYRLAAVDDVDDGQWMDPAWLGQLAGAALAISVAEGETKTQDLRVAR